MSLWRPLAQGMRNLLRGRIRNRDIEEEVRYFFEAAAADRSARGLSDEEARRETRHAFGRPDRAEEQLRSFGWENAARTFYADLRFAARQLCRNPGFAIVSILTLALGIGASAAIFSAIDPILFKPLPYPHPERILTIWNTWQGSRSELAYGTYVEISARSRTLAATAIYEPWQPVIAGRAEPQRLEGQSVSPGFFALLGVAPALGRDFRASEEGPHAPKVVILGDRLWRQRFHADPTILGRALPLDGDDYTVIGVMPRSFQDVLAPTAELWTPDRYAAGQLAGEFNSWGWGNHLHMLGRLRAGVTRRQAIAELDRIARTPWPQFPRPRWASLDRGLLVDGLQDDLAHAVKPALLAVFGAVLVVLAIACVNVINLVLARNMQRSGEFAVRGALGASRLRVIRQLVTESLLLSLLGGALGIAAALVGVRAIVALSPAELPRRDAIAFQPAAFLFAFALIAIIGLLAGGLPALHISRGNLQSALQQASRRVAGAQQWTRRLLVVAEIALALVLLVSAGLLLHSMRRLIAVAPGFRSSHLLTLQVVSSGHRFDDLAANPGAGSRALRQFFEQALEAVRRVPGVQQAAFTSLLPLSDDPPVVGQYGAQFEDQDAQSGGYNVFRYAVSPGYAQTMGIPLLAGRLLNRQDTLGAPQAALLSQSLARHRFGHRDPIGSRLHIGPRDRPWYTVVGVVGDVKQTSLAIDRQDAVYLSTEQTWFADDTLSFVIRAQGDAAALVPAVKAAIWSVDRDQPIVRVVTMDRLIAGTEAQQRFILVLFAAFGMAALVLAAVGLYGVLSGSVAERVREMAVRMALGASRRNILTLVLGDGMRLTALGLAIGIVGAYAASQALGSLLFGVSALDPLAWFGMALLLTAVAALACWLPAWRTARVDPATTLRAD